jgi:hypothetical protein
VDTLSTPEGQCSIAVAIPLRMRHAKHALQIDALKKSMLRGNGRWPTSAHAAPDSLRLGRRVPELLAAEPE